MICFICKEGLSVEDMIEDRKAHLFCMRNTIAGAPPPKPAPSSAPIAITMKSDETVKTVLQDMLEKHEHFTGVIVIAKKKDGSRYMQVSRLSGEDKAGLFCFFQSYIIGLFRCEDGE